MVASPAIPRSLLDCVCDALHTSYSQLTSFLLPHLAGYARLRIGKNMLKNNVATFKPCFAARVRAAEENVKINTMEVETFINARPHSAELADVKTVLEELFGLLEDYSPAWYTEEQRARTLNALLRVRLLTS
jgi:hypothetical protein